MKSVSGNFIDFLFHFRNYNKTIVCMEKLEGESCANQETFHVITSGELEKNSSIIFWQNYANFFNNFGTFILIKKQ